jgi:hypothetical protein
MIRMKVSLGTSPTVPDRLELAQRRCMHETATRTADAIGQESGSRQIAAATRVSSEQGDRAIIEIGAGVPFARIRDRGGRIEPRSGRVLRFADGEFRPAARQRGTGYVAAGAARFGGIAQDAFSDSFDSL